MRRDPGKEEGRRRRRLMEVMARKMGVSRGLKVLVVMVLMRRVARVVAMLERRL